MDKAITNEHFVPDARLTIADYLARGHRTAVHHLIRYAWARAVLEDLRPTSLLDLACGSGYGTYDLACALPDCNVVGGDYDPAAIAFAREHYHADNLSFCEVDITRWHESLGTRKVDCVVSFDTLEHVGHREIAMQNIAEHLEMGGVLLLSTPVRSKNVLNPGWEHHKVEFSRDALYDFLRRYFSEVAAPDLGTLPCVEIFEQVNKGVEPQYYLLRMNPVLCRRPVVIKRAC